MSIGEKRFLGFVFFMVLLESENWFGDKVLIFDDLIISLDYNRSLICVRKISYFVIIIF